MYVGKAKRNKDLQTAKIIEDTLSENFAEYCADGADDWVSFYWKDAIPQESCMLTCYSDSNLFNTFNSVLQQSFPNGLPKCETGVFYVYFRIGPYNSAKTHSESHLQVDCVVADITNKTSSGVSFKANYSELSYNGSYTSRTTTGLVSNNTLDTGGYTGTWKW